AAAIASRRARPGRSKWSTTRPGSTRTNAASASPAWTSASSRRSPSSDQDASRYAPRRRAQSAANTWPTSEQRNPSLAARCYPLCAVAPEPSCRGSPAYGQVLHGRQLLFSELSPQRRAEPQGEGRRLERVGTGEEGPAALPRA